MKFLLLTLSLFLACTLVVFAGGRKLVSGPMQGHTTATSTKIWILVNDAGIASVTLIDTLSGQRYTTVMKTVGAAAYKNYAPLTFDFSDLPTDRVYRLAITVDAETYEYNDRLYRTARTKANDTYRFMVTSCALTVPVGLRWLHPGIEDRVYNHVVKTEADFNLWIGDYLYYLPKHYKSENRMARHWVWKRKRRLIAKFAESMPQYSIWDDHEFGWNDADSSFPYREHALNLFTKYWANPAYGTAETPGCFFKFDYLDSEFFMLDDRYYRTQPTDKNPSMLGKGQLAWFKENLKQSKAVFKFIAIGSQVFNQVSTHECYWQFTEELDAIMKFIKDEKIEGVIFLTGDRHHSELMKTDVRDGYPVYEFTCSGITSFRRRTRRTAESVNPTRVPGTLADFQNYGRITISGDAGNRVCLMEVFDNRGRKVWDFGINQNELKHNTVGIGVPVKIE